MGWGLIALWVSDPSEHFGPFIESIYQKSFNGLYLGDGKFADLPENPFELYKMAQDIAVLEESAIDMIFDEGGAGPKCSNSPFCSKCDGWRLGLSFS